MRSTLNHLTDLLAEPDLPITTSFGAVAPYYDELMKSVPYRMWVGYYLLLLAAQDSHPKRILDVACGTGTMAEMLTAEGFMLGGFDLSPGMIERAKEKATAKKLDIDYWVADATEVQHNRSFDAAYSFFDSLNNILEPHRLQTAFMRIADLLVEGGSFIFDLNTAYAFEERLFDQQNLSSRSKLRYKWIGEYDRETKIIEVDMKFWYGDQEFHETHHQRAYAEDEVRQMLSNAGFGEIAAFHSYGLEKPRAKSDRIHYAAIKL